MFEEAHGFSLENILEKPNETVTRIAWSSDGSQIASGSFDRTIRLSTVRVWDLNGNSAEVYFEEQGIDGVITGLSWSQDGWKICAGTTKGAIYIWGLETENLIRLITDHRGCINKLAWSPDGEMLASCSRDHTIRIRNTVNWSIYWVIDGHVDEVSDVAWSPQGSMLASSSKDNTIRIWTVVSKRLLYTLKINDAEIQCVEWGGDNQTIIAGLDDRTVRVWKIQTGDQHILEGHTDKIDSTVVSHDGKLIASKSADGAIRLWNLTSLETIKTFTILGPTGWGTNIAFNPQLPVLATAGEHDAKIKIWKLDMGYLMTIVPDLPSEYCINAKVVLVGESGVGKSGLAIRMTEDEFRATESTHCAQIWRIPLPNGNAKDTTLELTVWDFAGQEDYRLIHQLFLEDTNVALLLFDGSSSRDPIRGVPYWVKVLEKKSSSNLIKFLVAARCDVGPVTSSQTDIDNIIKEYGFDGYFETSAKTGKGIDDLLNTIIKKIRWEKLPIISSPYLFRLIRQVLLDQKELEFEKVILTFDEIRQKLPKKMPEIEVTNEQIDTVIKQLQKHGFVYRLEPIRGFLCVLMKPELINQYCASIIHAAREHPREIGAVTEVDVISTDLQFTNNFEPLKNSWEEKIIREATVQLLISHEICFRDMGMLVFPGQIKLPRNTLNIKNSRIEVSYLFLGHLEAIYASLVVRLCNSAYFRRENLWKNTAEFSRNNASLGLSIAQENERAVRLDIYFSPDVCNIERMFFIRFIKEHLYAKELEVHQIIHLYCSKCQNKINDLEVIQERIKTGRRFLTCQYCNCEVAIYLSIEEKYNSEGDLIKKIDLKVSGKEGKDSQELHGVSRTDFQATQRNIFILHLSDMRISSLEEVQLYLKDLESDLVNQLNVDSLDYVVISGDISKHSTQKEYEAAYEFVAMLVERFGLKRDKVIVAPGNHDLNWDLSEEGYAFVPKRKVSDVTYNNSFDLIPLGEAGFLVRDHAKSERKFENFSEYFYKKIYDGMSYPVSYNCQGMLHIYPDTEMLFLTLNSCWNIDYYFQDRSSINTESLMCALESLNDDQYSHWVKIAVWHHPLNGPFQIHDKSFVEKLIDKGFQLCMHGHVHQDTEESFRYRYGDRMFVVGAGMVGSPYDTKLPNLPLQYNLLKYDKNSSVIEVETRKKDEINGSWHGDMRWCDSDEPKSSYTIDLGAQHHAISKAFPVKLDPMELAMADRNQVFISYCHKDVAWLKKLRVHLKPLERVGDIIIWSDERINPGEKWDEKIQKALRMAKVAVLLVTPDFLASDFITNRELLPFLDAEKYQGLTILWIAIRSSLFTETPIAEYQCTNDVERPLAKLSEAEQDEEWVKICTIIKETITRDIH